MGGTPSGARFEMRGRTITETNDMSMKERSTMTHDPGASRFAISYALVSALVGVLATPILAAEPYSRPDDTWISISGTVESVEADAFVLDYGEGVVTVEMDDGDRDADAYSLLTGDKVTVNGMIDDDFYETTRIEASSVYVEKLGTSFLASAADEEDVDDFVTFTTPIDVGESMVQGTVTEVKDDQFTLDTGPRSLDVDVDGMAYDPLDSEGYQVIESGDVVSVVGTLDAGFLEGRELEAESIVTLVD